MSYRDRTNAELIASARHYERLGVHPESPAWRELRREMARRIEEAGGVPPLKVTIVDYGYKHG